MLINSQGDLVEIEITPGNVDNRTPVKNGFLRFCTGVDLVCTDRSLVKQYISSEIKEELALKGCQFIAKPKSNQEKQLTDKEKNLDITNLIYNC